MSGLIEDLTDQQIESMISLPKYIPSKARFLGKTENGYARFDQRLESDEEDRVFWLKGRKNLADHTDFSVILLVEFPKTGESLILSRLNGIHEHRNKIEKDKFFSMHIHTATERYIKRKGKNEHYAVPVTLEYSTFEDAIASAYNLFNIQAKEPDERQKILPLRG